MELLNVISADTKGKLKMLELVNLEISYMIARSDV